MTNSADPDQLASEEANQLASEANWSGSTLFARQGISGFSRISVNINRLVELTTVTQSKNNTGITALEHSSKHWLE